MRRTNHHLGVLYVHVHTIKLDETVGFPKKKKKTFINQRLLMCGFARISKTNNDLKIKFF
jgi:hypothetical protein